MATPATATPAPGNTSAGAKKARAYQLTLNDVSQYDTVVEYLTGLKSMDYMISCEEEAPTTGHIHRHIYVHFSVPIRLAVKKCGGAHIEMCRGTPQQNIAYIEKEGHIVEEIGDRPQMGGVRVKDLKETASPDDLDWRMYNTWNKIHNAPKKMRVSDWHKEVEVIYIQGASGVGKSKRAHDIMIEKGVEEFDEVKHINGFWHGLTDGKGCAVYDDFRGSHMSASEFINFIDYNVHSLNIKGGSVRNEYNLIIITSIQRIDEIYRNIPEEAREQWVRRVRVVDMYEATDEDM